MPRLMALATLAGTYPSRLLGRNICINEVMEYELPEELETGATQVLVRYFRSRLWQRYLAGTRLNLIAGVHQHIHDLNAIVFLARAEAQQTHAPQLTEGIIRKALRVHRVWDPSLVQAPQPFPLAFPPQEEGE